MSRPGQTVHQLHASGKARTHVGPQTTYNASNVFSIEWPHGHPVDGIPATFYIQTTASPLFSSDLISNLFARTSKVVHMISSALGGESREGFISLFETYPFEEELQARAADIDPNSGEWITKNTSFQDWMDAESYSLLIIQGGAGVGKTTLISHIIHAVQADLSQNPPKGKTTLLHAICNSQAQHSASEIVCALIHQLLTAVPMAYGPARSQFAASGLTTLSNVSQAASSGSPGLLWDYFRAIINEANLTRVFVFLDGLDDCSVHTQKDIMALFRSGGKALSILVSTRPSPRMRSFVSKLQQEDTGPSVRVLDLAYCEDQMESSIDDFIMSKLPPIAKDRGYTQRENENVIKYLNQRPRAFLFVKTMLERLEKCPTGDLDSLLDKAPRDHEKFTHIFDNLLPELYTLMSAKLSDILALVLYACRPLTIAELAKAIGYDQAETTDIKTSESERQPTHLPLRQDLALLEPLLQIRPLDDTVRFCHSSVREYLVSPAFLDKSASAKLRTPALGHCDITVYCLRHLIKSSNKVYPAPYHDDYNKRLTEVIQDDPFLDYCLSYWTYHLELAKPSRLEDVTQWTSLLALMSDICSILRDKQRREFFFLVALTAGKRHLFHGITLDGTRVITELEFFGRFGIDGKVEEQFRKPLPLDTKTRNEMLKLTVLNAIIGGQISTLELISSHLEAQFWKGTQCRLALPVAIKTGLPKTIAFVLSKRSLRLREVAEAACSIAEQGRMFHTDTVFLFSTDVRCEDSLGLNVLHHIFMEASNSNIRPSSMILALDYFKDKGINLRAVDGMGNTLLHHLCWSRDMSSIPLIKALIEYGIDPNAKNSYGCMALHYAARRSFHEAFKYLAGRTDGNLGNMTSNGKLTPLHWAAYRRFDEMTFADDILVFHELLSSGCELTARSASGESVLSISMENPVLLHILSVVFYQLDGINSMHETVLKILRVIMAAKVIEDIWHGLEIAKRIDELISGDKPDMKISETINNQPENSNPEQISSGGQMEAEGRNEENEVEEEGDGDDVFNCFEHAIATCAFLPRGLLKLIHLTLNSPADLENEDDKPNGSVIYAARQHMIVGDWLEVLHQSRDWEQDNEDPQARQTGYSDDSTLPSDHEQSEREVSRVLWSMLYRLLMHDMKRNLEDGLPCQFTQYHRLMILRRVQLDIIQFTQGLHTDTAEKKAWNGLCSWKASELLVEVHSGFMRAKYLAFGDGGEEPSGDGGEEPSGDGEEESSCEDRMDSRHLIKRATDNSLDDQVDKARAEHLAPPVVTNAKSCPPIRTTNTLQVQSRRRYRFRTWLHKLKRQ